MYSRLQRLRRRNSVAPNNAVDRTRNRVASVAPEPAVAVPAAAVEGNQSYAVPIDPMRYILAEPFDDTIHNVNAQNPWSLAESRFVPEAGIEAEAAEVAQAHSGFFNANNNAGQVNENAGWREAMNDSHGDHQGDYQSYNDDYSVNTHHTPDTARSNDTDTEGDSGDRGGGGGGGQRMSQNDTRILRSILNSDGTLEQVHLLEDAGYTIPDIRDLFHRDGAYQQALNRFSRSAY